MMIEQVSIFLQNDKGHLASACRTLAENGINMHALYLADTKEFGIARMICDSPNKANRILNENGFRSSLVEVCAIRIANEPGGLASLLEFCDSKGLGIEYCYCFIDDAQGAIDVLKFDDDSPCDALADGRFELVDPSVIYELD